MRSRHTMRSSVCLVVLLVSACSSHQERPGDASAIDSDIAPVSTDETAAIQQTNEEKNEEKTDAAPADSEPATTSVKEIRHGVYLHSGIVGEVEDKNSTAGTLTAISPDSFCATDKVPLRLGVSFGVEYLLKGYDESIPLMYVKTITRHPPITGFNQKTTEEDVWTSNASLNANGDHGGGAFFTFEHDFELQPGTWSIEVIGRKSSFKQVFEVSDAVRVEDLECVSLATDGSELPAD